MSKFVHTIKGNEQWMILGTIGHIGKVFKSVKKDLFHIRRIIYLLLFPLLCTCTGCKQNTQKPLRIATAANMHQVMDRLVERFEQDVHVTCQIIPGSSGKLAAQIIEGAPFDVFVSADMEYPEAIHQEGLATSPPTIYAYGQLILWTAIEDVIPGIQQLTDDQIKRIAIANPSFAPYGQASIEVLRNADIESEVKSKLVYGESIAQANQFISSRAADIGFTALSVVRTSQTELSGQWIHVDTALHKPIAQGIVVIVRDGRQHATANNFLNFLHSQDAKNILFESGYLVP